MRRRIRPTPTPIIGGEVVKSISELIKQNTWSEKEAEACIQFAAVAPQEDPAWGLIQQKLLSTSCAYFCSEIMRGPKEFPYEGKFILGRHHLEWDELINKFPRLNILAARDHGKSFFFTVAYSIWKAGFHYPTSYGIIFSATQPQAEEFLAKIKAEILANPALSHLVPFSRDRFWSVRKITLRNGSVIRAAGFGVKIRGGHPDYVVCDDVLNDDDIYSDMTRRKNIDYFLSAIAGMVHRSKQLIVVGTPLHQSDLYDALRKTGEYECREYPAEDAEGVPLWPARYSRDDLDAKRRELGSAARYAREYLCRPLSDDASLFPAKLFTGPEVRMPYVLGLGSDYWEKRGCLRYTGVDIAMSAETGGDYFVIFTIAVDQVGNRWLANIRRGKGWSFTRQIDEIKEEHYLMRPEVIYIEANQMQRVWTDEIARTTDLPVKRFFTLGIGGRQPQNSWKKGATNISVNKHHIDRGVPSLRIPLEHGKWRIPRGNERTIELTDIWIGEMGSIGWLNGKVQSVSAHDDTVMACLTPGQRVTTFEGMRSIEDVVVGDRVLTHRGRWREVTKTMSRVYAGVIRGVHPAGIVATLRVTPEHPVFAANSAHEHGGRNGKSERKSWEWRQADSIKAGDYVLRWTAKAGSTSPELHGRSHRIVSVDSLYYVGHVYNLEVEEDASYCVDGVVVHNCWMAEMAVRQGGGNFDWLDSSSNASKALLAAPSVTEDVLGTDVLEAERHALAAVQEKRPIDMIDRDAYLSRVRSSLRSYAEQAFDAGDHQRAIYCLSELKRLDAVFRFRSYDADFRDVVKRNGEEYLDPTWQPQESAPTMDDLGDT